MEPNAGKPKPSLSRFAGMGLELAGAVLGFCLLGMWIDHRYKTSPNGTLVCALLGLVGGMYNFIRQSMQMTKEQWPDPPKHEDKNP